MTSSGVSNASKMGLAISRPVMSRKMPLVTAMIAVVEIAFLMPFSSCQSVIWAMTTLAPIEMPDKKNCKQTDDQSIATDGRQSLTAGKLSDNSNIY